MSRMKAVFRASEVCHIGQARGSGVGDGGVDDGHIGAVSGGDHALGGQGGDGDDGVIVIAHDLRADLAQDGGVILTVEILVLDGDALFGSQRVQLGFHGGADLVQGGVVQLLDDGGNRLSVAIVSRDRSWVFLLSKQKSPCFPKGKQGQEKQKSCGTTLIAAFTATSERRQHAAALNAGNTSENTWKTPFPLPSAAHLMPRFSLCSQLCRTLCGCADTVTPASMV